MTRMLYIKKKHNSDDEWVNAEKMYLLLPFLKDQSRRVNSNL